MSLPSTCCTSTCNPEPVLVPGTEGAAGADGTDGSNGLNAFTQLTGTCTIPAVGANVTVTVLDCSFAVVGQTVFVGDGTSGGTFTVYSISGTTSMVLTFVGAQGDSAVGAVIAAGGLVTPSGPATAPLAPDSGDPEGVVIAPPGQTYLNTDDDSFWIKKTGVSNTGWLKLIGMVAFLFAALSVYAAPPIIRNSITTNSEASALGVVTNISTAVAQASVSEAGACLIISTGVVSVATSSSTELIKEYNYTSSFGAVGVETNANVVLTNAGTWIVSFGANVGGANGNIMSLSLYTNGTQCTLGEVNMTGTATLVSKDSAKSYLVTLPANARVDMRVSNDDAAATSVDSGFLVIHGVR